MKLPFAVGGAPQQRPSSDDAPRCPHMEGCAMFPLLSLSGTLKTWQTRYCAGEYTTCERHRRASRGVSMPPDLMPNGVLLRDRKKAP